MFKKMMYTTALALVCVHPLHAIDMWHSDTIWAYNGQCEATFTFDSGGFLDYPLNNVRINVDLYKGGKKVGSDRLEVKEMGRSESERYTEAELVSELACEDLSIVVTKATAISNNKRVDLLKTKQLAYRPFKPFSIKIPK
jgi:hypothetical protein